MLDAQQVLARQPFAICITRKRSCCSASAGQHQAPFPIPVCVTMFMLFSDNCLRIKDLEAGPFGCFISKFQHGNWNWTFCISQFIQMSLELKATCAAFRSLTRNVNILQTHLSLSWLSLFNNLKCNVVLTCINIVCSTVYTCICVCMFYFMSL